jgi:hypothetical protein
LPDRRALRSEKALPRSTRTPAPPPSGVVVVAEAAAESFKGWRWGQNIRERGGGADRRAGGGLSEEARRRSGIRRERVGGARDRGKNWRRSGANWEDGAVVWITFGPKGSNLLYQIVFQVIHMAHWAIFKVRLT